MRGRRPGRRPRAAQDQGRPHRHARCWAPPTTAPAGSRPGARSSPARRACPTSSAAIPPALPEELRLLHERYGYDGSDYYGRGRVEARFRLDEEPHEPNRFDWVVEIDPYDPAAAPMKRTALGRTSHEGATVVVNKDGRVVVYMGDDDYFEHIYRFVSAKPFDPANRAANRGLLDEGTLSVARVRGRRHAGLGEAGPRRGPAHRRERLSRPGRASGQDPVRRGGGRRHPDGPARRVHRPTRSPAASTR